MDSICFSVRTGLEGPGLFVYQKIFYCISFVGGQYIWSRLQSFSAFRRWGDSEQVTLSRWHLPENLQFLFTCQLLFMSLGMYCQLDSAVVGMVTKKLQHYLLLHKHLMLTCMGTRLVKQLRLVLEALNLIRDSRQCPAVMRALPMRLWCWLRTWNLVVTLRPVYTVWFHSPEFCWTTNPWPCITVWILNMNLHCLLCIEDMFYSLVQHEGC